MFIGQIACLTRESGTKLRTRDLFSKSPLVVFAGVCCFMLDSVLMM
jgi:hypothetical protein